MPSCLMCPEAIVTRDCRADLARQSHYESDPPSLRKSGHLVKPLFFICNHPDSNIAGDCSHPMNDVVFGCDRVNVVEDDHGFF